jgi:filamentous hemagglutinin
MTQGAVTQGGLAIAADKMRALMIEDSAEFAGVVDAQDNKLSNLSAASEGVNDDGKKIGGTRIDLDLLCGAANERCKTDANGNLALDAENRVQFDQDKAGMSMSEFIATPEGQKMIGATGGIQGAKGTLFGVPYAPGSWQDQLIEAFAGPHDYIGGSLSGLYDEQGNAARDRSNTTIKSHDIWSATGAIAASAPFAAAGALPPNVWQAISIILGAAR